MLTPDDFLPPEVIDLEVEADARGYLAEDELEPGGTDSPERPHLADDLLRVRFRRR